MWNKLLIKELIEKYREIIRESWHERDRAKNETRRDEMQFYQRCWRSSTRLHIRYLEFYYGYYVVFIIDFTVEYYR